MNDDLDTWKHLRDVDMSVVSPSAPASGSVPSARALLEDAGCAAFAARAAAERQPLTLVLNDHHRFTDTRPFVDAVFAILDAAAVQLPVRVLIASGTHPAHALERSAHEERIAAPYLARIAELEWHDCDAADLARIGGYEFHHWLAGGGHYLACGSMEPHYFAGVTGAHKTMTVGVMSRASIERNHAHAMSSDVAPLKLAGNPVHEGVVAALGALESTGARVLALNQVISNGRVVGATAGHPLAALEQGLATVRRCFAHRVERPLDLIVARLGAPLDRDLYQADKGIKNTEAAVRDRGVLVVEAECKAGIGIRHFVELLEQAPTHAAAREIVAKRGYRLGDHKAVRLRALTDVRGVRVALVSPNVDASMSRVLGMQVFRDRTAAAVWVREELRGVASPHGLIVEDAGNVALELAT
jgi:nickel-dependent lactate racemase